MKIPTGMAVVALAIFLASGCSSFNSPANDFAERNEAAIQRQQAADAERPALDNKQVYLDMIKKMQERSLYFASIAHIDAYQKSYGSTPEIQRLYADALRATGQEDAAEKQYKSILNSSEASAAWHGLGLLEAQRGNSAAAIVNLREANRLNPTNAAVLSDLSYALMNDGNYGEARMPLMQAVEMAPGSRRVISNLALFFLLSGDEKKANSLMVEANVPSDVRVEIYKRKEAIVSRSGGIAASGSGRNLQERVLPTVATSNGMQLQLQLHLLQPNVVPRNRSE